MPDYLTKEEIRQWRSSLEKITLEDYAKKLGKVISEEKETNDMVDMVYKHSSEVKYISAEDSGISKNNFKAERISSLAQKSFEMEKEMSVARDLREFTKAEKLKRESSPAKPAKKSAVKEVKAVKKEVKKPQAAVKETAKSETKPAAKIEQAEIQISFKKNLTPREQAVFEHFLNNKNQIVYAKELAQVLELPRDYVYKYIKNLRAKMNENAIQNADNGGFVLEME